MNRILQVINRRKEEEIRRLYFTTGEVAKMLGISITAIHLWLKDYQIDVKKSRAGVAKLTHKQVDKLKLIQALTKEFGMTHKGVKKYLKQNGWKTYGTYEVIPSFKGSASHS